MAPIVAEPARHSLAFERLVEDDDDVVGLLAYALFKRSIREAAQRGEVVTGVGRDPSPTVITTYRHAAESIIGETVGRALNDNLAELQQSAAIDAIAAAAAELKSHIDSRTDFRSALLTNVAAWIVTLAITVLIVWLLGAPDPARVIADQTRDLAQTVRPGPR